MRLGTHVVIEDDRICDRPPDADSTALRDRGNGALLVHLSPEEWARNSRISQGLTPTLTDPVAIGNIATIVRAAVARMNSASKTPDGFKSRRIKVRPAFADPVHNDPV